MFLKDQVKYVVWEIAKYDLQPNFNSDFYLQLVRLFF